MVSADIEESVVNAISVLKGKRVLVVEDNGLLCYVMEQTLREAGCEIVGPFGRLDKALQEAARSEFDVALLDINLHGQLVSPLAEALKDRQIPYLLTSAYHASDLPRALEHDKQLRKPFTDVDLLTTLASLVRFH